MSVAWNESKGMIYLPIMFCPLIIGEAPGQAVGKWVGRSNDQSASLCPNNYGKNLGLAQILMYCIGNCFRLIQQY